MSQASLRDLLDAAKDEHAHATAAWLDPTRSPEYRLGDAVFHALACQGALVALLLAIVDKIEPEETP